MFWFSMECHKAWRRVAWRFIERSIEQRKPRYVCLKFGSINGSFTHTKLLGNSS